MAIGTLEKYHWVKFESSVLLKNLSNLLDFEFNFIEREHIGNRKNNSKQEFYWCIEDGIGSRDCYFTYESTDSGFTERSMFDILSKKNGLSKM